MVGFNKKTLLLLAVSIANGSIALAQDGNKAGEKPRSSSRMLEEVVVTAQKRAEDVQDVPIAISAFSNEKLDAMGVSNTRDLQIVTPGLTMTGTAGYTLVTLRGVGTEAFISSFDPAVATYVDGLYVPAQHGNFTELGVIERVEVLKGPQGTLFGRNSTGGAINIVTRTPGLDPEFEITAEVGSYNKKKIKLYGSTPLTDWLALSLSGIFDSRESYYDLVDRSGGLYPQSYTLRDDEVEGGRAKLAFMPTDNFSVVVSYYDVHQTGSTGLLENNTHPSPLGRLVGIQAEENDYTTSANSDPGIDVTSTALGLTLEWEPSWFDVKFIYGDQEILTSEITYDFDGSQQPLIAFKTPNAPNDLTTYELQFLSKPDGLGFSWLEWVGGFYRLEQRAGYEPFIAEIAQLYDLPLVGDLIDTLGEIPIITDILPLTSDGVHAYVNGILETESDSVFLQTTADVTEWMSITAGARYQEETRDLVRSETGVFAASGDELLDLFVFNQPMVSDDSVSAKFTVSLRPFAGDYEDTLIYLGRSKGFKSGSYNVVSLYTAPEYIEPETVISDEIGIKSTFFDGAIQLNAAIFKTSVENLQVMKVSLLSGGAVTVENAAEAEIKGAEMDAIIVPFSANPGFVLTMNGSYLDATYVSYPGASGFDENTGLVFTDGDFSGNQITRTPEFTGTFSVSQTLDFSEGSLEVAADAYYNSGFFFTAQNTDLAKQDEYYLVNLRASYLYEPWNLRLTGFVRNALEEKYKNSSITVDFGTSDTLAEPRVFGLKLHYAY